jgi:uncharacterized phage protein (TIGR01671 family)
MREILFRGKTIRGEWVYGDLLHPDLYGNGYSIEDFTKGKNNCCDVLPETIGQYTGLTDNNGKKIFEGDIVKFGNILGAINYGFGCFCVKTNKPDWKSRSNPAIDIVMNEYMNEVEVIGNIHDNPELLEGGNSNEKEVR